MNFHNVYLVFPIKIKKSSNVTNNLEDDVITVNNFFALWIKELDIKRYGDGIPILPLTNTVEIYKNSDAILTHMENDALKTIQMICCILIKKLVCQLVQDHENIRRSKMLRRLIERMKILMINLAIFLIIFRMNIII